MIDRAIFDDDYISKKPFCRLGFISYLYNIAIYKPQYRDFGGTDIWLEKGDVAVSLRSLKSHTGWDKEKIRTLLKRLENRDIITMKTQTPVTIFNIRYLAVSEACEIKNPDRDQTLTQTEARQQPDSNQTQPNKAIKKEGKKERKKQKNNVELKLDALYIFQYWKKVMNKPKAKFIGKRKRKVEMGLAEGYNVEEIKKAIDGCAGCIHNQGNNGNGKAYNDLELICRDESKLEMFIGYMEPNIVKIEASHPSHKEYVPTEQKESNPEVAKVAIEKMRESLKNLSS